MRINLIFALAFCFLLENVSAQGTIDVVLSSIEANNRTLQALKKSGEAEVLQNGTGLTLENPQVNVDYMIGSPAGAGNQSDVVIAQSFDFPTVYAKRKSLSLERNKMIEIKYDIERKELLHETRLICVDQIYRNKLHQQYLGRKKSLEQLVSDYQKKVEKGDGTIIEVNKSQLLLINLIKEMELNRSQIRQNNEKLTELNGGTAIELTDTLYPAFIMSAPFDVFYSELTQKDPYHLLYEQEGSIAQKQVELSRSMTLPKFELGYHYQGILGQRFNGAHAALTIPLWEHKNTVKAAEANTMTIDFEKQDYENERYHQLKSAYENYGTLANTLKQYQSVFSTFSNTDLLLKALNYGEITVIEYVTELSYYFTNYNTYLETEKEMHKTIAVLLKYQ